MGFKSLVEDMLKMKFIKNDKSLDGIPITKDNDDLAQQQIAQSENGSILDQEAIAKFRTLSDNRHDRYAEYESLLEDTEVSAALEMYADDATQYDPKSGKIIWVESDDPDIAAAGNRLIDVLQLEEKVWRHIYSLCAYGDLYLRVYREGDNSDYEDILTAVPGTIRTKVQDESRPMEEYVEYIDDPSTIYDLQIKDKTAGFVRIKADLDSTNNISYKGSRKISTMNLDNIDLYDRRSFVHICLSESISRNPELIAIVDEEKNKSTVYKVKTGKSLLADVYNPSQTTTLLENSLLLSRLTKSPLIRLLQIEVGDMPKPEVESLLRRVKNMIEQKIALNTNNGTARSYNSPGPMENMVYIPTKNGKGTITVNNLGGDVNIKDIADIQHFNNKKLAALKIPKQYLNYDSPEGLGNGTSLIKLSSRYAHTVMRIQKAYISGITTLLNFYYLDKGLDYVNKFTVKMVSPSTVEDSERDEQMTVRMQQVSDIMSMISEFATDEGKLEIIKNLLNTYLNLPDVSNSINKYPLLNDTDDDMGFDDDTDDFGGFGGPPHSLSSAGGPDESEDFDIGPEPESEPAPAPEE